MVHAYSVDNTLTSHACVFKFNVDPLIVRFAFCEFLINTLINKYVLIFHKWIVLIARSNSTFCLDESVTDWGF